MFQMIPMHKKALLWIISAFHLISFLVQLPAAAKGNEKAAESALDAAFGPAAAPGTDSQLSLAADAPLSTGSPRLVLKHADSLLVLDKQGMIDARAGSPYGLYEDDTRYLSDWQIKINGKDPNLLSCFDDYGFQSSFLYSIQDRGLLKRELVVLDGLNERLSIHNYSRENLKLSLKLTYGTDFKDMFEVRGQKRSKAGYHYARTLGENGQGKSYSVSAYKGVDGLEYKTSITYDRKATRAEKDYLIFDFDLPPLSEESIEFRIDTSRLKKVPIWISYDQAYAQARSKFNTWLQKYPHLQSDWDLLNKMYSRSLSDLYMLKQNTPNGPCLAAGLPWFSVAFGRDQCVVGLQTLPFMPDLSRDLIRVLAAYQGKKKDAITEEDAGRIMHELRLGELARCKEIAFTPYYGTVDATPLWLLLVARYCRATGDIDFANSLWTNVESALDYLEQNTSQSDPFLYYGMKKGSALSNQGWKDSADSIMHADGRLAEQPIAVSEVQGYLYEAYVGVADLATQLGKKELAGSLQARAQNLKLCFKNSFWLPHKNYIALALDGQRRPCEVISSNPGHLLSSGILDQEMTQALSKRLLQKDMYSGWGIRTLSSTDQSYNPISYHNGTIWPHDNAMIVEGLCMSGSAEDGATVFHSLLESAKSNQDRRLPELFCGFDRSMYERPVPYLVSCVPQAWASGSILQMLRSVLGISLRNGRIRVTKPLLPEGINRLRFDNLRSAGQRVSLSFQRGPGNGITVSCTPESAADIEL